MHTPITLDGSLGTGGGQILRTALALSMALGIPFRMVNIRAGRSRPGLAPQHLACVRAAQQICGAAVQGDTLHSQEIVFHPRNVAAGEYHFAIGTGRSVSLLLQMVARFVPRMVRMAPPEGDRTKRRAEAIDTWS